MAGTSGAPAWRRNAIRTGLVVFALIATLGGIWATGDTSKVDVTTAQVTRGPVARTIIASGTIQAIRTVEVGTQVSGVVESLEADFNSIVHKDQVIARLDPSVYEAQAQAARAAQTQAEATLKVSEANLAGYRTAVEGAQITLTRAQQLFKANLMTAADFDAANIAMDTAKAQLQSGDAEVQQARASIEQAKASVKQAERNLSFCIIRSPIDGVVVDRGVAVGQTLAASVSSPELFRIGTDFKTLQLEVDVDESDVAGPKVGETVTFQVEAYPNQTFTGTVSQVRIQPIAEQTITATAVPTSGNTPGATTAVASVVGYATMINVENPDERLRPGMTATVSLGGTRRENAIRVPNGSLTFRPSAALDNRGLVQATPVTERTPGADETARPRLVWKYDGQRFIPLEIRTGLADGQWTEVLAGPVQAGDTLVTNAVLKTSTRLRDHLP